MIPRAVMPDEVYAREEDDVTIEGKAVVVDDDGLEKGFGADDGDGKDWKKLEGEMRVV